MDYVTLFKRPAYADKTCPTPGTNFVLTIVTIVVCAALLADAILLAPKRCTSAITSGTKPFSECSTFQGGFECHAVQVCADTKAVLYTENFIPPGSNAVPIDYPFCPYVGAKIPYKAAMSSNQMCDTIAKRSPIFIELSLSLMLYPAEGSVNPNYPNETNQFLTNETAEYAQTMGVYVSKVHFDKARCNLDPACANAIGAKRVYDVAQTQRMAPHKTFSRLLVTWVTPDEAEHARLEKRLLAGPQDTIGLSAAQIAERITYPPHTTNSTGRWASFETCTGFYHQDVCPNLQITIGVATGNMGIVFSIFATIYALNASRYDMLQQEDQDKASKEMKSDAVSDAFIREPQQSHRSTPNHSVTPDEEEGEEQSTEAGVTLTKVVPF